MQASLQQAYHSFGSPPFAAVLDGGSIPAARRLAADALMHHVTELLATARDRQQQFGSWQMPFLSAAHEAAGRLLLLQVRHLQERMTAPTAMQPFRMRCRQLAGSRHAAEGTDPENAGALPESGARTCC